MLLPSAPDTEEVKLAEVRAFTAENPPSAPEFNWSGLTGLFFPLRTS